MVGELKPTSDPQIAEIVNDFLLPVLDGATGAAREGVAAAIAALAESAAPKCTVETNGDGVAVAQPVSLHAIRKIGGSAKPVWLFDHAVLSGGVRAFVQTLAAGNEARFSPPIEFVNGIYLDVPAVRGVERVTNGGFDDDVANWTAQLSGASIAWSTAGLVLTAGGSGGRVTQLISGLTIGSTYRLTGDIVAVTGTPGPTAVVRLTSSTDGAATGAVYTSPTVDVGAEGAFSAKFTATATSITLAGSVGPNAVATFKNFSLRDIGANDGAYELEVSP